MTDHDPAEPDCPLNEECKWKGTQHQINYKGSSPNCWVCEVDCQCALIAKVEQRGREMERAERLACICDTNPTTTDGPSEDCPQHGRPYVEAYDGGYRAGRADALAERGAGEPLDAEAILDEWTDGRTSNQDGYYELDWADLSYLIQRARSSTPAPLTLAELEDLPVGSVVLDKANCTAVKDEGGSWHYAGNLSRWTSDDIFDFGPVRLLHRASGETA